MEIETAQHDLRALLNTLGDAVLLNSVRQLRSFRALPSLKKRLILKSLIYLWVFRLALWLLPYQQIRNLEKCSYGLRQVAKPRVTKQELAQLLTKAARYVPRTSCLVRALAGSYLFHSEGHAVQLVIGAQLSEEAFKAHAWLESDGQVILGNIEGLNNYRPLS